MDPKVLVVEDELAIREMVLFALRGNQFKTYEARNAKQAELLLQTLRPDIILLDWMLPGKSGLDFLIWLKAIPQYQDIRVILLTAKAEEENKIRGLEYGADDYITKPFSPRELIARIKAVLRRGPLLAQDGILRYRDLEVNLNEHHVSVAKQEIVLTRMEYNLLVFFLKHLNRSYTREQLISMVWSGNSEVDERTVDTTIRRLRRALQSFGYHQQIETIRGVGYRFSTD